MEKTEILKELEWLLNFNTPIHPIIDETNNLFVKREDLIPFSFGGNKVRIAANYFIDLIQGDFDTVVTYGSGSSNLCRVIAAMAKRYNIQYYIVSPEEEYSETPNSVMVDFLGARIKKCPVANVSETIDRTLEQLKTRYKPYFIYGGGHGKIGTESYRTVLRQIIEYENRNKVLFDYVFITLATGTSMSGLVVENEIGKRRKKIIGVSIARELERASRILNEAIEASTGLNIETNSFCIFDNRIGGYGKYDDSVKDTIQHQFNKNAINLDLTYTGKGFSGMQKFLSANDIKNKDIVMMMYDSVVIKKIGDLAK